MSFKLDTCGLRDVIVMVCVRKKLLRSQASEKQVFDQRCKRERGRRRKIHTLVLNTDLFLTYFPLLKEREKKEVGNARREHLTSLGAFHLDCIIYIITITNSKLQDYSTRSHKSSDD